MHLTSNHPFAPMRSFSHTYLVDFTKFLARLFCSLRPAKFSATKYRHFFVVFTSKEICISYLEAKTSFFPKISDYTYELLNLQFLPTVSIYSSGNSSGEKRNLSAGRCQIDATLRSLKIFTVIFVTFAKGT